MLLRTSVLKKNEKKKKRRKNLSWLAAERVTRTSESRVSYIDREEEENHHLVISGNDDHYLPAIEEPVRGSNIFRLDARYEVSSAGDDDEDEPLT